MREMTGGEAEFDAQEFALESCGFQSSFQSRKAEMGIIVAVLMEQDGGVGKVMDGALVADTTTTERRQVGLGDEQHGRRSIAHQEIGQCEITEATVDKIVILQ